MAKTVFVDGNPALGVVGTVVDAAFLNSIFQHRHDGANQDGSAPINFAADTGAANAYVIALTPALTARIPGMPIYFEAVNQNTGASTINDGLGAVALVRPGGTALQAQDIPGGAIVGITWNGTAYQLLSVNSNWTTPIVSQFSGLRIANNAATPNTKLDVSASSLAITNGSLYQTLTGVSFTINAITVGANGLSTDVAGGALATSTWYYVYAIYNGATVAGLLSTSATAPALPAGYSYSRLIGVALTNSSAYFHAFVQEGRHFVYDQGQQVSTASAVQSWSVQTCAAFIPPICTRGFFQLAQNIGTGGTTSSAALRKNGSLSTTGHFMGTVSWGAYSSYSVCNDWVDTDTSQEVQLNISVAVAAWSLLVLGFELNL